jgi:hypothetical protein
MACLLGAAAFTSATAKENGGAFLLGDIGARAVGLQAVTSIVSDASAVSVNPAGLAKADKVNLLLYSRESNYDSREHYVGVAWPEVGPGTLGIGWKASSVGSSDDAPFVGTTNEGQELYELGYNANALSLGYGVGNDDIQVGAGFAFAVDHFSGLDGTFYEDDQNASGFAGIQLGVSGNLMDVMQYGLSVRNIGGKLGDEGTIPVVLSAGISVDFEEQANTLITADFETVIADYSDNAEVRTRVRTGVEYHLDPVALRFGTSLSEDRVRSYAGFGVLFNPVQLDYAFQLSDHAGRQLPESPRHFVSVSYTY